MHTSETNQVVEKGGYAQALIQAFKYTFAFIHQLMLIPTAVKMAIFSSKPGRRFYSTHL